MPSRSFSVPHTTSLALEGAIDIPAPSLPIPLMLEIRDALPALEKALAPELSPQCLPLCMQLLSTWVLVSSNGSQCENHSQQEKSSTTTAETTTRSMTRSKLSRWFTQSFARKKGVAPMTDKDISENDDYFDLVHKIEDYEDYGYHYDDEDDDDTTTHSSSSIHSPAIASEDVQIQVQEQIMNNDDPYGDEGEEKKKEESDNDDGNSQMSSTFPHSQLNDEKQPHGLPQSLTKRSISSFLNRLGMSVRKVIVGKQQYPNEKLGLPSPVLEENKSITSVTINKDWDDEHIWAPRDTIPSQQQEQQEQQYQYNPIQRMEGNTRERKPNASLSSLIGTVATKTTNAAAVIPTGTVKASKTDMDVCREQSVPFIKMGLSRHHPETKKNQHVDVDDAQQYRLSSTSFDLRWQERFHEQQHDKIDMTLRR